MEEYLKPILKSFPYIIVIAVIVWAIMNYRQMKLQEKLAALQIKDLENKLGVKADEKVVDSVLSGSFIEKATSVLNI